MDAQGGKFNFRLVSADGDKGGKPDRVLYCFHSQIRELYNSCSADGQPRQNY